MTALSYGLNIPKKTSSASPKSAPRKPRPIFADDDADGDLPNQGGASKQSDAEDIAVFDDSFLVPSSNSSNDKLPSRNTRPPTMPPASKPSSLPISAYGDLSSNLTHQKHKSTAETLDPSIYDYDTAYDAFHASRQAAEALKRKDALERKPRYMAGMFAAAEASKRAHLLAEEKRLQREREAEGDEFKDKEAFVTEAYKMQQAENKRLEEGERRKADEEERKRRGRGMQGFYSNLLEEGERRHREAVAAAAGIKPEELKHRLQEPKERSDAEIARELNAKGANIALTEEGQVADKRQLLTAGLNIVPKKTSASSAIANSAARSGQQQQQYQGRSSAQKAQRERQTRMLEQQLEQADKRKREEEDEDKEKVEKASKSRKTEEEVMGARERYLARKRQQQAESGAGKKG